jgi:multisubunit Na+/H+ antiporter MnhB subunit
MYPWMVYLHILAVAAFLLAHGASSVISLRLRSEPDPDLARAWLQLTASNLVFGALYASLLLLLVTGVIAGLMGHWWRHAWIWLSLFLLIAIVVAMFFIGSRYYSKLRKALGMPYFDGRREQPATDPAPEAEVAALLANSPAISLTVIGFGGIALILWLMMFKPF